MASLEADPSGHLRIKFRIAGQEHPIREPLRLSDTKANRRFCRHIVAEVERELAARDYDALCQRFPDSVRLKRIFSTARLLTVADFARTWLGELRLSARASTVANYEVVNRLWIEPGPIAQKALNVLTAEDGAQYALWLSNQGTTNATRNKAIEQLRRIFKRARQLGQMKPEQDPLIGSARFASSNEGEKEEPVGAWSIEEREALIKAAYVIAPWQGCAVEVAFFTGLRRGELFGLKWSDLDFDGRTIKVRRSIGQNYDVCTNDVLGADSSADRRSILRGIDPTRSFGDGDLRSADRSLRENAPKTERAAATIEMLPRVRNALLNQRQRVGLSSLWVFPNRNGGPQQVQNFVTRLWPRIVEIAAVPFKPFRQTRHTFAVLALEAGGEGRLLWVQRMLRHSTTQMLINHYLKHAKPGKPGQDFITRFEASL